MGPVAESPGLSDVESPFIACQPCPVRVLLLNILKLYLLAYETGLDNHSCRLWWQMCGYGIAPSY